MSKDVSNLILEHLKAIRHDVSIIKDDMQDVKMRLTNVEEGLTGVHRRMDRF